MANLNEACWEGYTQVGMKDKGGRMVPNCVPVDEAFKDDLTNLIKRGFVKKAEPKPDFKSMSPEERREYMASQAERDVPWIPLDMIAKGPATNRAAQRARYSMSTPMSEDEINEYCNACLMEYLREHANVLEEAEYQGRKVPLGKPMRGDSKKFKVYVRDPKTGNVKKVNFGDKTMRIKKSNPARRKSFRARHRCATAKDRTSARYWSCRAW